MYKLQLAGIPLPIIYVADDRKEVAVLKEHGIPYVVRPRGYDDRKLAIALLGRYLRDKFPGVKWSKVFGMDRIPYASVHTPKPLGPEVEHVEGDIDRQDLQSANKAAMESGEVECCDMRDGYRERYGGFDSTDDPDEWIEEDMSVLYEEQLKNVNIDALQQLQLLPQFVDDIAEAIRTNLVGMNFQDGWNKKLGCQLGNWKGGSEAPNLMILDVSGSIPWGVTMTMTTLIESLAAQCNADLIVTGSHSIWYPKTQDLPDPERIRLASGAGGCNEARQFHEILKEHVLGRHWGNVVVFGDDDSPYTWVPSNNMPDEHELQRTKVDRVLGYYKDYYGRHVEKMPGYGRWILEADPDAEVVIDSTWVEVMKER